MKNPSPIVLFGLLLGCAPAAIPPEATPLPVYGSMSSADLWAIHASPPSPRDLLMVEAELGVRGEQAGSAHLLSEGDLSEDSVTVQEYLGKRTAQTVGSRLYTRDLGVIGDRDCADFATPAQAQRFFIAEGGSVSDPHGLDRDGDGNACEWGVELTGIAARERRPVFVPAAAVAPVRTYHRGPRGGCFYYAGNSKEYVDHSYCS